MIQWKDVIQWANEGNLTTNKKVTKSEAEWQNQLNSEQYRVTRLKGTERAHSSDMCYSFDPGIYNCICCNTKLFDSTEKFDSGTGWPSFTQPIKKNAVAYIQDKSHGMSRIETVCNTCDAHLGHVFPDGPAPSGLRFCINAVSLEKEKTV